MRKWNFGDVFVKGHTERLWQKWNLYSGLQESKVHTQSSTPHCPHEDIKEWITRAGGGGGARISLDRPHFSKYRCAGSLKENNHLQFD